MYESCYGLRERPFELTPNPGFLFLSPRHREALSHLEYGLASGRSLTLLTGEAGTGKTTLVHAALESDRCVDVRGVYVNNPTLSTDDFVSTLAERFALGERAAASKAAFVSALERALRERRARGEITALIVDEAQSLSPALLEEIRLLANVETPTEKLLPLVLAGQPELAARLEEPGLRQLKQRVALRCEIAPFEMRETAAYIGTRIHLAGGSPARLFTREAIAAIHQYSTGIPRTINVICDNALMTGMALGGQLVTRDVVLEVCTDLCLRPRAMPGAQVPGGFQRQAQPEDLAVAAAVPADVDVPAEPQRRAQRVTVFAGRG